MQRALRIEPGFQAALRNLEQVEKMLNNRGEGATEASRYYADRKEVVSTSSGESDE